MDVIPTWTTPHHFSRFPAADDGATTIKPVFTYLLASCELVDAVAPDEPHNRLTERLGLEWIESLIVRLEDDSNGSQHPPATYKALVEQPPVEPRSRLSAFLHDVGINSPGRGSFKDAVGLPHATTIPADATATVAAALPLLRSFVNGELAPFTAELAYAADHRERPDPNRVDHAEGDGLAAAHRLLKIYGPPLSLAPFHAAGRDKTLWGYVFDKLAERIAVEIFELFTIRPHLRRCRFCNRTYVPTRPGAGSCSAHLWRWQPNDHHQLLETCNPDAISTHNARDHERERKRRHQAMRRKVKLYGPDAKAVRDYQEWIADNGLPPGPQPHDDLIPPITRDPE